MQSKSKGKSNKGDAGQMQACRTVYFGQDGDVVCIMAFGEAAARVPGENRVGCLCDVIGAKPRVGQLGVLYADEMTRFVVKMEAGDGDGFPTFPYSTTEICNTFATMGHAQEVALGSHIDVVVHAVLVEERCTNDGRQESYVSVQGVDMNNTPVGPVLLWGYGGAEVLCGCIYILRGLRVAQAKKWSHEEDRYMPRLDGARSLDCSFRTAVEDVSEVKSIANFFNW